MCEGPGPAGGHTEAAVTRAQAPPLRPLSRSVRGQGRRLSRAPARHLRPAQLGHETQSRTQRNQCWPGLETRHELLPGLVSSLTSSSPINLAQTRLTALPTGWMTSLAPTPAVWPSLMPVTLPPSVGASTLPIACTGG